MPLENRGQLIRIRGSENASIELEDYADFLRDIVFIHDRIWILASGDERFRRIYFSHFFYVRVRRVPADYRLRLVSSEIGSPFELKVKVDFGESFGKAADALANILRSIATLNQYRKQARLNTRSIRARVQVEEEVSKALRTALRERRVELDNDSLALLLKDVKRIEQSPLQIESAESEDDVKQ